MGKWRTNGGDRKQGLTTANRPIDCITRGAVTLVGSGASGNTEGASHGA